MHLVAVFNVNESAFAAFVLVIQKKRIEKAVDEVAVGVLEATLELDAVIFWCIIVAAYVPKDDGAPVVALKFNQASRG